MNRNYRVVYNQSTGTYVAVAEFAKSHTKSGSKKSVVATLVATVGLLGLAAPSQAAFVQDGGTNNGDNRSLLLVVVQLWELARGSQLPLVTVQ